MKMRCLLLGLCLCLTSIISGQWTILPSGTSRDLLGIDFLNADFGVAVGQDATVLITTDGGATWTPAVGSIATKEDLRNVLILSPDTILVAGSSIFDGQVHRTVDGGQSWQQVISGEALAEADAGLLALSYDTLHYSTDRGDSWSVNTLDLGGTVLMEQMVFSNDSVGYIAGNVGGFATYSAYGFRTVDGGSDWAPLYVFDLPNAHAWTSLAAPSPDTIYMFTNEFVNFLPGSNNQLVRMSDFYFDTDQGIDSWRFMGEIVNNAMPGLIISSAFKDSKIGYAGSTNGSIYRTDNGGVDWTEEFSGSDSVFQIIILPDDRAFAVGSNGLIVTREATNSVMEQLLPLHLQVYPNPAIDWISVQDAPFQQAAGRLFDVNGRLLRAFPWSAGERIFLGGLAQGTYVIELREAGRLYLALIQKSR